MANFLPALTSAIKEFISEQKMFFTATAPMSDGRVNTSPKGMDSFRILDDKTVAYLDLTGSGNETAAHIQENGRLTIMMCSFSGAPLILRLYGKGEVIKMHADRWKELSPLFPQYVRARQIIVLHIESVQTSCGFGIPIYEYQEERTRLTTWTKPESVEDYWRENNQESIDGLPTYIL